MTHIPIMVRVVDEVVSSAAIDRESSNEVITSCYNCGGIYFYQVVEHIIGTKMATDTMIYCCQCGQSQGGMYNDPEEELDERMQPKKKGKLTPEEWEEFWAYLVGDFSIFEEMKPNHLDNIGEYLEWRRQEWIKYHEKWGADGMIRAGRKIIQDLAEKAKES